MSYEKSYFYLLASAVTVAFTASAQHSIKAFTVDDAATTEFETKYELAPRVVSDNASVESVNFFALSPGAVSFGL